MPPVPDPPGARLALVIGTATYTDPGFRRLRAPAQDVADMVEVLADPAIGGFTVTQVLDRAEYEIRRAIGVFLADRKVNDLVVVYLSCHGVLDARGWLYFAATDTAKSQLSSTGVESTWLRDQVEDCRARRKAWILDCCYSGSFDRAKGDTDLELERRLGGNSRGFAVLTASRAEEYSYEGTPLPGAAGRSVFTAGLVDGLRSGEADRDGDGYISVEDAYLYAADQVKASGGAQSPQRWLYGAEGAILAGPQPARGHPGRAARGAATEPGQPLPGHPTSRGGHPRQLAHLDRSGMSPGRRAGAAAGRHPRQPYRRRRRARPPPPDEPPDSPGSERVSNPRPVAPSRPPHDCFRGTPSSAGRSAPDRPHRPGGVQSGRAPAGQRRRRQDRAVVGVVNRACVFAAAANRVSPSCT